MWRRKRLHSADMHPACKPPAPAPVAHRISTPLLSPLPFSDPTHFPFILAYLRDGHVPPLPSGLLELQQLRVEAEFFAMAELAEAAAEAAAGIEAAAEKAAAAAAEEQKHAASQRLIEASRARAVHAASEAVGLAEQAELDARIEPAYMRYEDAVQHLEEIEQAWKEFEQLEPGLEIGADVRAAAQQELEEAQEELRQTRADPEVQAAIKAEAAAGKWLRDALLARLCALGADLPAAQAQLKATHPELAKS